MLDLERAWFTGCSRCANEGLSYEEDMEVAHIDLRGRGWTRDSDGYTYCPECSR